MKEGLPRSQENELGEQRMAPGEALRFIRRGRKLSQKKLGNLIGVSEAYICRIEKDNRNFPLKIAQRLVEELGLNPEEVKTLLDSGALTTTKEESMSKEGVRTTVKLSPEEYDEAMKIVKERGITFTEVMRTSLRLRAKLEELAEDISETAPGVGKMITVRSKEGRDKMIIF